MSQVTRKFLVLSDDTEEAMSAAVFAAMRAAIVGAGLVVLRIARPSGFAHWRGLDEEMRAEARDAALFEARAFADQIHQRVGVVSEIVVGDGDPIAAIHDIVSKDENIKVLYLGAGTGKRGPGPLVARLGKGKPLAGRPIAITVVPGGLTEAEMNEMGGMIG